jgi:hypothetical protein
MLRQTWATASAALLVLIASCSPAATEQPVRAVEPPAASGTAGPAVAALPATSEAAPAPAAPPGKLAAETLPAGLSPISEEEAAEASAKCRPLSEAIGAAAKKSKDTTRSSFDFMVEFLRTPPKLKDVDVPRCSDILLRDMAVRRAEVLESLAMQHLRALALSMKAAYDKQPGQLCPSAGPTPADLQALEPAAVPSNPQMWDAEGWKCARFAPQSSLRFQYELRSDPKTLTYELFARGFPVKNAPAAELYLQGKVGPGSSEAPEPIYRR